ncbi:hypothetical protein DRO54_03120 [Candidatus Bathyarchaeota archaeon]|nr:MAG: hypothetical protein DRO54_03120 [Candidatus Bathyarchaeota archaeon]
MEPILEILKDGKWHSIKEIEEKTKLHEYKLQIIIGFLTNFNFVEMRKDRGEIKAAPDFLRIIRTEKPK